MSSSQRATLPGLLSLPTCSRPLKNNLSPAEESKTVREGDVATTSTTTPSGSIAAPITSSDRSTPDLPTAGLPCFYGRRLLPAWDGPAKPRVRLARMKQAYYAPPEANTTLDGPPSWRPSEKAYLARRWVNI